LEGIEAAAPSSKLLLLCFTYLLSLSCKLLLSDAVSFKMDELAVVAEEVATDKNVGQKKYGNAADPDFVARGFTCDSGTAKKFFVDDTEEQNVTKLPQVATTTRVVLSSRSSVSRNLTVNLCISKSRSTICEDIISTHV